MSRPSLHLRWLPLLFIFQMLCCSLADVGTASQYDPPYAPTACYGRDNSQFPASNLFGVAGEGIWDNGAACGRQYLVRCISAVVQGTCIPGETIQVRIVDRAQTAVSRPTKDGTTVVLSTQAYAAIADPAIAFVNIEFQQW